MTAEEKMRILPFLDDAGKIKQLPARGKAKEYVLRYLAEKFETSRAYSEKEVNRLIDDWHTFNDYFILRRLLVDYRFLKRTPNGSEYRVIEKGETSEDRWIEKKN